MASTTIDGYVASLASMASNMCGLDINVILAQWLAEEGISSVNDWYGYNPAGISPGNSQVDAYAIPGQLSPNGFLMFYTPAAGAKAYATLYNTDAHYAGVRAAIKTGNPMDELNAIIQSPWDAGHYGGDGHKLYNAYSEVTGTQYTVPSGLLNDPSAGLGTANDNTAINNQIQFPPTNYSVVANSQRFGNILYGRRYRILVSNSSGVALDVSDLHCTFNIQIVINQQPPFSQVVIYNLNPQTENYLIKYGDRITIEAGYEGSQYGLIFDGDVVEPIRDKPDNVTYRLMINALAGDRVVNQAFANFTLNKGQTARSVVENLASKASVPTPLGDISSQLSTAALPRGKVVFGYARDYFRQIAQGNNMAFSMHDGKVNLIHALDPPKGTIFDLTPSSGLIGQPAQNEQGVTFQCLLNPSLQIGSLVHIANDLIQAQTFQIGEMPIPLDGAGIYRIVGINHAGDTRGDSWYSNCTCVSQSGKMPSMFNVATDRGFGN